jgi:hypothetical protein
MFFQRPLDSLNLCRVGTCVTLWSADLSLSLRTLLYQLLSEHSQVTPIIAENKCPDNEQGGGEPLFLVTRNLVALQEVEQCSRRRAPSFSKLLDYLSTRCSIVAPSQIGISTSVWNLENTASCLRSLEILVIQHLNFRSDEDLL